MKTLFYSLLDISAKYHQNRSITIFEVYRFKVGAFLRHGVKDATEMHAAFTSVYR